MEEYILERVYLKTETLGSIYAPNGNLICKTMELPWVDNKVSISCIPEISVVFEKQEPSFGRNYKYFRSRFIWGRTPNRSVTDKYGRPMSTILMHPITYVKDLRGCIGVGSRFFDFNKDGILDMAESTTKLDWMTKNLPDIFLLTIKKKEV